METKNNTQTSPQGLVGFDGKKLKVGFNSHRLIDGDPYYKKEIDFVRAVNAELKYNNSFLAQAVDSRNNKGYLEENDEKIVLSVIQWLGTPVGQGFLEKVSKM